MAASAANTASLPKTVFHGECFESNTLVQCSGELDIKVDRFIQHQGAKIITGGSFKLEASTSNPEGPSEREAFTLFRGGRFENFGCLKFSGDVVIDVDEFIQHEGAAIQVLTEGRVEVLAKTLNINNAEVRSNLKPAVHRTLLPTLPKTITITSVSGGETVDQDGDQL